MGRVLPPAAAFFLAKRMRRHASHSLEPSLVRQTETEFEAATKSKKQRTKKTKNKTKHSAGYSSSYTRCKRFHEA